MGRIFLFLALAVTLEVPVSLAQTTAVDFVNRGNARYEKQDYVGAIADYTKAIELDPKNVFAFFFRGDARDKKQDYDGAIADYTKAIELDPRLVEAYIIRGNARRKKQDYDGATADYTKVIELGNLAGYYSRAWQKFYTKDTGGAYQDASAYLELNGLKGDIPPYAAMIGYLSLKKVGKTVAAKTFLGKWIKQFEPDAWTTKILRYFSGELTSAQLLALAVDNDKLTEAHVYIGEILLISGNRLNAGLHFRWVRDNGNKNFSEYGLAMAELKLLDSAPAKPIAGPKKKP